MNFYEICKGAQNVLKHISIYMFIEFRTKGTYHRNTMLFVRDVLSEKLSLVLFRVKRIVTFPLNENNFFLSNVKRHFKDWL